jgi:hypothetical protein
MIFSGPVRFMQPNLLFCRNSLIKSRPVTVRHSRPDVLGGRRGVWTLADGLITPIGIN